LSLETICCTPSGSGCWWAAVVGVLVRLALGGEGGRKNAVVSSREFAADGRLTIKEERNGRKVDRGQQGGGANKRRTSWGEGT